MTDEGYGGGRRYFLNTSLALLSDAIVGGFSHDHARCSATRFDRHTFFIGVSGQGRLLSIEPTARVMKTPLGGMLRIESGRFIAINASPPADAARACAASVARRVVLIPQARDGRSHIQWDCGQRQSA
jgi:hypothetical protein